jgi:NAD(P)-dependent dehydrogenase (short-subunit alcohol dehydrogenase family)
MSGAARRGSCKHPRMGRLDGKVAVVTGGGNGLGRASAVRFAEEGAAGVVIADLLPEPAQETVRLVEAAGGRAVAHRLEASSRADNDAMAQLAIDTFGGLDVVVTAAGISYGEYTSGDLEGSRKRVATMVDNMATPWVPFLELPVEDFQRVLDVNLTGTLLAIQACASRMVERGTPGSIITIASILAKASTGSAPYNVSKAGVWMLTKVAARVLAPKGVRVNAIGPGYTSTNMTAAIKDLPEEFMTAFMAQIPMGRFGEPVEIANTALFLASDESSYFTGEILHPDGGFYTD